MSWYANYYIGKMNEDGKIYPVGPYDNEGELHPGFWRSRSFASELWMDFHDLKEDQITEELRKEFEYPDYYGETTELNVTYLPLEELPTGNYMEEGYYLLTDIQAYEEDHDEEVFWERLSPTVYLKKMEAELKFGVPKPKVYEDGEEEEIHSCADYGYYRYPKYFSKEYEAHILRMIADTYQTYKANERIVILCSTG